MSHYSREYATNLAPHLDNEPDAGDGEGMTEDEAERIEGEMWDEIYEGIEIEKRSKAMKVTCSWCHKLNPIGIGLCSNCGHRSDLPRTLCNCTQCIGEEKRATKPITKYCPDCSQPVADCGCDGWK